MRAMYFRSLYEADSVKSFTREIRSACNTFSRCAPETVFGFARMSLGWLRDLLEQKRVLPGRHAARKPEVGQDTELRDECVEAVVSGDPRVVKPSRCERMNFILFLSRYCALSRLLGARQLVWPSGGPAAPGHSTRQL